MWKGVNEQIQKGRYIFAVYKSQSGYPSDEGGGILFYNGKYLVNHWGGAISIDAFKKRSAFWAYAPPGTRLHCETRDDDPVKIS